MLREKASRLYELLVVSPARHLGLAALVATLVAAMSYPKLVLIPLYSLLAFLIGFGACSRPYFRRLLGILFYMLPYTLLITVFHATLGIDAMVGFASGTLTLLVLGVCGVPGSIMYAISSSLLTLPFSPLDALSALVSSTISILLVTVLIGCEGVDMVRAAVLAWADDNYSMLERVIEGEKTLVSWKAVGFRVENSTIYLVEPGVHYGPFRGAGSSRLPRMIREASRGTVYALHGCGSHERNIVSSEEAARYARHIVDSLWSSARACVPLAPVAREGVGGWGGALLGCAETPLVILWNKKGIEDFSCEVIDRALRDRCIIIDAHNKEVPSVEVDGLNETIQMLLEEATPCENPKCCWSIITLDEKTASEAGLCDNWILVLRYVCNGRELSMVVVPANNVDPSAAEKYEKTLGNTLLITIDDHSCAAMRLGEGVKPLQWSWSIAKAIRESLEECMLRSCKLLVSQGSMVLTLWGRSTLKKISVLLERGLKARFIPLLLYAGYLSAALLLPLVLTRLSLTP